MTQYQTTGAAPIIGIILYYPPIQNCLPDILCLDVLVLSLLVSVRAENELVLADISLDIFYIQAWPSFRSENVTYHSSHS